ncbi:MAG: hypothetical protein LBS37_01145 [Treponema sp.]|jgi:hypothetical protein|nr:hypothetical protein [Treponema sp.]
MAKISNDERRMYNEKIKKYKAAAAALLSREKTVLMTIKNDQDGAAFKRFSLADEMLDLVSNYIIIDGVSRSVLKVKNEDALNDGRKSLYKSLIYLEETVGTLVDAPFSEYEEMIAAIETVSAAERYLLVRKMGLAINLLENAYGYNTKWKWAFVELEGRYAAAAKNSIDLRNAFANSDPRSPNYESTVYHLRLVKKLLAQAADRYREKYELSTGRIDDFKQGMTFLSALRRLHLLLGDREEAETVKKKLDIWSIKLEKDLKKQAEMYQKKNDIST